MVCHQATNAPLFHICENNSFLFGTLRPHRLRGIIAPVRKVCSATLHKME